MLFVPPFHVFIGQILCLNGNSEFSMVLNWDKGDAAISPSYSHTLGSSGPSSAYLYIALLGTYSDQNKTAPQSNQLEMALALRLVLKAFCAHCFLLWLMVGRVLVDFLQWIMVAYPVFRPQSILSATVVLVLGSLILFFDLMEFVLDIMTPRQIGTLEDPSQTIVSKAGS